MSALLYGADGTALVDTKGDKYPDLPLGTYFYNAGLSHQDAVVASGECLRRVKALLTKHLRELEIREPGAARAYSTDWQKRDALNRQMVAAALLSMGFDSAELREIDKGLGLGLQTKEREPGRATVHMANGDSETFQVIERCEPRRGAELGLVLQSEKTGIYWH